MGIGKETAERVLGGSISALDADIKDDNARAGVTIRFKCSCMKQRAKTASWLSSKGEAVTPGACGRIVAEAILEQHAGCLGIAPPSKKRTWLDTAGLQSERSRAIKAKVCACMHAL